MSDHPLCGVSAFRFHRIPPQFLGLYPPVPVSNEKTQWRIICKHPLTTGILKTPLHRLSFGRSSCTNAKLVKDHLFTNELPFGSIQETELGIDVTSPLMTLFTLTPSLCEEHLIMAMYELCGSFAIFQPSPELQIAYDNAVREHQINPNYDWHRVVNSNGTQSNLWQRPPLIEVSELQRFARETSGMRGHKKFLKCARSVTGCAASPFEVEASMLFSLPPDRGGCGFKGLQNNAEIHLPQHAQTVSGGHRHRYADIYFKAKDKCPPLDIECQSAQVHNTLKSHLSDSDRTAALQAMGVNVIPLTHDQIYYSANFKVICKLISKKLSIRLKEKTHAQQAAETQLRERLFIDWETLGTP